MSTLAEDVEDQLREHIVTGLLPAASRLQMDDLRARYATGGSPIREALSRLAAEGLVVFESNKGFRVPQLSRADLVDIAVSRVAVEAGAIRLSILKGDEAWEARVVGALHRYKRAAERDMTDPDMLRTWEAAHDDLHAALIEGCGCWRCKSASSSSMSAIGG
jgi:DNA-binding GntR family transcriptional regulator